MNPGLTGHARIIHLLRGLTDAAILRRLDLAFAQFISELEARAEQASTWPDQRLAQPPAPAVAAHVPGPAQPSRPALTAAAALLSRMESLGHTSLPILALANADDARFAWPADARDQIAQLWQWLPDTVIEWQDQLSASASVLRAGHDQDRGQPLVLAGDGVSARLYLRRFWRDEQAVEAGVLARCTMVEAVDESQARVWLDRLFDITDNAQIGERDSYPPEAGAEPHPTDWQKIACALALRAHLTVITGGPGTGKTYTAARLLALLFAMSPSPDRLRIALAAPTGKAAARLRQSIDSALQSLQTRLGNHLNLTELTRRLGGAVTLHALLGSRPDSRRFHHHEGNPLDVDVVIIDEASMIHLEMMAALIRALPPRTRLVLLGDKDQLASVEAGAVLGDLCKDAQAGRYSAATSVYVRAVSGESIPSRYQAPSDDSPSVLAQQTIMLRQSRRFDGPIGLLAQAVNGGDSTGAAELLICSDAIGPLWAALGATPSTVCTIAARGRDGAQGGYRHYLLRLRERPAAPTKAEHEQWVGNVLQSFDQFRVLCAIREGPWGVEGLNQAIEQTLASEGLIAVTSPWYAGRPVMVTRNDPALKIFNGDVGIALPSPDADERLRVYFLAGEELRSVSVTRMTHVETAYAMTVHKSQGSEFEHTVLVLPARGGQVITRELVYTGITRARSALSLITEKSGLLEAAVARVTQRTTVEPQGPKPT